MSALSLLSLNRPSTLSSPATPTTVSLVNQQSRLPESTDSPLAALPQANRFSEQQAADYYVLLGFWQWLRQFYPPVTI